MMKLLNLSLRNITVKWWRSLTLGFFIFSICLVMVISSSFILTAKSKVEKVILNGITGHVQIRSDQSMEGDMVVQYSQGWDALKPLNPGTIDTIKQLLLKDFKGIQPYLLTRQSTFLTMDGKREETMLVGIEKGFDSYKDAFLLTRGRYLDPESRDEILLTEEQANSFKLDVGDKITITTKNMYGMNSTVDLKVAGIGNYVMLSLFSYKACYTNSSVVRKLADMNDNEATDMILFIPQSENTSSFIKEFTGKCRAAGIKYTLSKDEVIKSEDLKVDELNFDEDDENEGIKISTYDEMGETFKGVSDTMFAVLNILVLFLIVIVSILIINLVYMIGLERYREIGTLRAIGFTRLQVVRVFMGEILFVSILAGLLGVLLSTGIILILGRAGLSSPIAAFDFIMGKTINLEIDIKSIISNLIMIIGFSFAASFFPAYKACSIVLTQSLRVI